MAVAPFSIRAIFEPGAANSAIVTLVGDQLRVDMLTEQYGYLKKMVIDTCILNDPIEVKLVEEGGHVGLGLFPRGSILGWREVKNDPVIKAVLTTDIWFDPKTINVADTVEELFLVAQDGPGVPPPSPPSQIVATPVPVREPIKRKTRAKTPKTEN